MDFEIAQGGLPPRRPRCTILGRAGWGAAPEQGLLQGACQGGMAPRAAWGGAPGLGGMTAVTVM
eukprot:13419695-Alexandrium_andersonii.AAC.1